MHGKRAAARDHHDAFEQSLVDERLRLGVDRHLGFRKFAMHGALDALLDRADAIERKRAAHRHDQIDEQGAACRPHPDAHHRHHARYARGNRPDPVGGTRRRSIRQCVDSASPKPPAGDADEHRHDYRGRRIRPAVAERDRSETEQHRHR